MEQEELGYQKKIQDLESKLSRLNFEMEEVQLLLEEERDKREFYQLISDFTFGWEIWLDPDGEMKFCSPSCFDLTGFTSSQIVESNGFVELLIYQLDREKTHHFLINSLQQVLVNKSIEFRILTRHKQLRWCAMNVRGVYNRSGKYMGIRISINDITALKNAMGHIYDLSTSKELENRAKMRFKSALDVKERELVSFLLQLSQKNELINATTKQLKKIIAGKEEKAPEKLQALLEMLSETPSLLLEWEMLVVQLENIHPEFLDRLKSRHANLTLKEKKLCAYVRLGLSSREISKLLTIATKSVDIARVRLRKKMKLTSDMRLSKYLHQL